MEGQRRFPEEGRAADRDVDAPRVPNLPEAFAKEPQQRFRPVAGLQDDDRVPPRQRGRVGPVIVLQAVEPEQVLAVNVERRVEVKGELDDVETGKIKIERDGDYTKIELDLDGVKEQARVPTSWLRGGAATEDQEFKIAARRVKVDKVAMLGACSGS